MIQPKADRMRPNRKEASPTKQGSKRLRPMITTKRPRKGTTMDAEDQAGQADLKDITKDEISTKKESSNMKIVNSNTRLYDKSEQSGKHGTCTRHEGLCSRGARGAMITDHGHANSERRLWWIGWRQWFG